MTDADRLLTEQLQEKKRVLDRRIAAICEAADRNPDDIHVIAVTKSVDADTAAAAFRAGFLDLAENRPQELVRKQAQVDAARWHLIGTLQRNKVRSILSCTSLIHAVDSLRLAEAIARIAGEENLTVDALLQVNVSGESSKHGFAAESLASVLPALGNLPGITWRGLMTMAPLDADDAYCEQLFDTTRQYRERFRDAFDLPHFDYLSMGMSADYAAAIRAGATHIRLGSAIFGDVEAK